MFQEVTLDFLSWFIRLLLSLVLPKEQFVNSHLGNSAVLILGVKGLKRSLEHYFLFPVL